MSAAACICPSCGAGSDWAHEKPLRHSVSIYDRCHCFPGRLIGMIVGNIAFSMTFATTIIVGRPGSPQHAVSSS
jgi:hypothetical protein